MLHFQVGAIESLRCAMKLQTCESFTVVIFCNLEIPWTHEVEMKRLQTSCCYISKFNKSKKLCDFEIFEVS